METPLPSLKSLLLGSWELSWHPMVWEVGSWSRKEPCMEEAQSLTAFCTHSLQLQPLPSASALPEEF